MHLRSIARGLQRLLHKSAAEDDLRDEVAHYIEMSAREHMRQGRSAAEAERLARVEFGGVESAKEAVRTAGWDGFVDTLWQDVRFALRAMRRSPSFAVIACLTLALGIGANTTMFSVIETVMLRPLPYRDAKRLVLIWTDDRKRGLHQEKTASRTIDDWRQSTRTLSEVAYFSAGRVTLGSGDDRERSRKAFVSGNVFAVLGAQPALGRTISPNDERDAAGVAVISHSLWRRRFGGDSSVIGKPLYVEDAGKGVAGQLRIIGVMPAGFFFPDPQTELWTPATTYWRFARESVERFPDWARRWTGLARVNPGLSVDDVRSDLAGIGRRLALSYPSDRPDFPGFDTNVQPILESVAGASLQSALWLLLAAVSLVLLVACANAANLLLARGAARQHELALRRALGAARTRIVRQLLVESLVLACTGGAIGVALAVVATRLLGASIASRLPRIDEVGLDSSVLLFALATSLVSALVFGLAPALRVSNADPGEILKERRASGGRRGERTRGLLIVGECALTVMLLAGAGLVLKSLERVRAVDPGFDAKNVLMMRVEFPTETQPRSGERDSTTLSDQSRAQAREQALTDVRARVEQRPGVQSAGFIDDMFISGQGHASIGIPGHRFDTEGVGELNDATVSPRLFETLRVPLRRGRYLTRDDARAKIRALWPRTANASQAASAPSAPAEPVLVNEAFVRRFFPDEDPIGKRFCIDPTARAYWYVIVGVVGDMQRQGLDRTAIPEYFGALLPSPAGKSDLLVRTRGDPLALVPTIRGLLATTYPGTLVPTVSTVERQLGESTSMRALDAWLLSAFAGLALVLAAVGIYGVVHFAVTNQTREIGIRIALGAAATDVVRMIVARGLRMPLIGLLMGLAGALAVTRSMTHLLFGTSPLDPLVYAAVALTLGGAAAAACYVPARRAATIQPVEALRHE